MVPQEDYEEDNSEEEDESGEEESGEGEESEEEELKEQVKLPPKKSQVRIFVCSSDCLVWELKVVVVYRVPTRTRLRHIPMVVASKSIPAARETSWYVNCSTCVNQCELPFCLKGTSAGFKTPQPPKQAGGKPQKGSRSLPNTVSFCLLMATSSIYPCLICFHAAQGLE